MDEGERGADEAGSQKLFTSDHQRLSCFIISVCFYCFCGNAQSFFEANLQQLEMFCGCSNSPTEILSDDSPPQMQNKTRHSAPSLNHRPSSQHVTPAGIHSKTHQHYVQWRCDGLSEAGQQILTRWV